MANRGVMFETISGLVEYLRRLSLKPPPCFFTIPSPAILTGPLKETHVYVNAPIAHETSIASWYSGKLIGPGPASSGMARRCALVMLCVRAR